MTKSLIVSPRRALRKSRTGIPPIAQILSLVICGIPVVFRNIAGGRFHLRRRYTLYPGDLLVGQCPQPCNTLCGVWVRAEEAGQPAQHWVHNVEVRSSGVQRHRLAFG